MVEQDYAQIQHESIQCHKQTDEEGEFLRWIIEISTVALYLMESPFEYSGA